MFRKKVKICMISCYNVQGILNTNKIMEVWIMKKYQCPCGYEYDPELGDPDNGVAAGTAWEDVPADWVCPTCGLDKDSFTEM